MVSLYGYFAGLDGDISWHNTDEEFGTLIFGQVTYEMMASYWPTPEAIKDDPIVAHLH